MLTIALELATTDKVYEDIATKFFEHFLYIASAMNNIGGAGISTVGRRGRVLLRRAAHANGRRDDAINMPLKVRWLVGLIPLCAVTIIERGLLEKLPDFTGRLQWVLQNRPENAALVSRWNDMGVGERRLVAILRGHRMNSILKRMLDESEFLSAHGVRSLSRYHLEHPYVFEQGDRALRGGLRARQVTERDVWRQFKLARARVVPWELHPHRVAAELLQLLWRRFQGRVPYRFRANA